MTSQSEKDARINSLEESVAYLKGQLAEFQTQKDREQAQRRELVTTVSHELRTPVAIIKECLSQMMDRIPGDLTIEQEQMLSLAMQNVDRLTGGINHYIDILRPDRQEKSRGTEDFPGQEGKAAR